MAKTKWIVLPGGRIKRWKQAKLDSDFIWSVPPHWYRNYLNKKERQKFRKALKNGKAHCFPYVHPHTADWFW